MITAVVILNWNGKSFLEKFLPILIENSLEPDVEIIVADNASSDGSLEMMRANFSSIRIIELDKNYGFAGGYNRALSQINADYFVLLNSDVQVTQGWLKPLINHMNNNNHVVACQPKVLSFNNPSNFEHAGASGGFIDKFGYPFCRGRIFDTVELDIGQYDSEIDVFWATGACLMVRAQVYNRVGGLDDEFHAHMEEIDLCWRMKNYGYSISCVPESVIYHVGGGTLDVKNPFKIFLNFRNNLFMLYKNIPEKKLNKVMFVKFFLDYLSVFQFVMSGKFKSAVAVCKARKEFSDRRNEFKNKREEIQKNTICSEHKEIYNGSVVFDYFIRKKRKFSDLKF